MGDTITQEFGKNVARKKQGVKLSLIVFLRSDLFSYILRHAREGDKLNYTQIDWDDELILQRVIEERFYYALGEKRVPDTIWKDFFVDSVRGQPTKEYLTKTAVIPRPRDVIYFCKAALNNAINHNHQIIQEQDILQAEIRYSQYAFETIVAEFSAEFPLASQLIYKFSGAPQILNDDDIFGFIAAVNIPPEQSQDLIELLCDTAFLGLEIAKDNFKYLYDERDKPVIRELSAKYAEDTHDKKRYQVHRAFYSYLRMLADRPN